MRIDGNWVETQYDDFDKLWCAFMTPKAYPRQIMHAVGATASEARLNLAAVYRNRRLQERDDG